MDTTPTAPVQEAPDAELVQFLGGEVESEAPPSEPKAPAQPAAQPEATDGAQPRDTQGRFTKADAPAAAPETQGPSAPETPEAAPPEPAPSKPFSYRAYGADHSPFAGAVERNDGVLFPPDAIPQLRQVLAEGHNAESRRRQAERERETKLLSARGSRAELVQQAELTLQRLAELRKNPDALQQWFQDLDRNWAVLEAEVERDALKAQLESRQQQAAQQAIQQQVDALRPYMRQTLEKNVAQMIQDEPELKGLDAGKMSGRLWDAFFHRVFKEAEQDGDGYRKGEILIDYDAIRSELQYEASLRRPVPQAQAQAPAPVAQAKPPVAPPPVVPTKGQGGRTAPKVPKFDRTEDVDKWFDEGGYNEL